MKKIFYSIKELIFRLLGIRKITYFDLLEEYEDYVRGQDLTNKNTLVGTVRSKDQYDLNLKYRFYHIPERYIEAPEKIEYVALYRSKNIFGNDEPGIIHIGRVLSYVRSKRRDIKELYLSYSPDDFYYRFEIAEWEKLSERVIARESAPHVSLFVNKYLLDNVRFVNELFVSNNDEYKLHLGLMDIIHQVYDGFFVGDIRVHISKGRIILITKSGKISYKVKEYKRWPLATLKKISEIVFQGRSQL